MSDCGNSHVKLLVDVIQDAHLREGERVASLRHKLPRTANLLLHVDLLVLQCVVEGVELPGFSKG